MLHLPSWLEVFLTEGFSLVTFIAQGTGQCTLYTHTVYTQCDATAILDALIWIGGSERLHHSCLPSCPCHQFSLHGYSPDWHLVSCFLLSPLSLSNCKYIHSAGAERACPRVTLNPRVGGLIPIIFLCTLLLWHCHSIVLYHFGQGRLVWPFLLSSAIH